MRYPNTAPIDATVALAQQIKQLQQQVAELQRPGSYVPWIDVSFSNGWANAPGWQTVQYRRVGDMVQLRGHLYNGTGGATAFTLPAGYRPPSVMQIMAGVTAVNVTINTNGTVQPVSNAHISLFREFSVI